MLAHYVVLRCICGEPLVQKASLQKDQKDQKSQKEVVFWCTRCLLGITRDEYLELGQKIVLYGVNGFVAWELKRRNLVLAKEV